MQHARLEPATPAANRISGIYKTTRDGGLDYSYSVTWRETSLGVIWKAAVSRGGKQVGSPWAIFFDSNMGDYASYLHRMVGTYIENRWHVE